MTYGSNKSSEDESYRNALSKNRFFSGGFEFSSFRANGRLCASFVDAIVLVGLFEVGKTFFRSAPDAVGALHRSIGFYQENNSDLRVIAFPPGGVCWYYCGRTWRLPFCGVLRLDAEEGRRKPALTWSFLLHRPVPFPPGGVCWYLS